MPNLFSSPFRPFSRRDAAADTRATSTAVEAGVPHHAIRRRETAAQGAPDSGDVDRDSPAATPPPPNSLLRGFQQRSSSGHPTTTLPHRDPWSFSIDLSASVACNRMATAAFVIVILIFAGTLAWVVVCYQSSTRSQEYNVLTIG